VVLEQWASDECIATVVGVCYAVADRFAGGEDVWANILLGFISLFMTLSFDSVDFEFGFTTLLFFFFFLID
jgi:hypothetical protein